MSVAITATDIDPASRRPHTSSLLAIPIEYLNGWLFGISANRVNPEIRDRQKTLKLFVDAKAVLKFGENIGKIAGFAIAVG